jgi:hypothetical protein
MFARAVRHAVGPAARRFAANSAQGGSPKGSVLRGDFTTAIGTLGAVIGLAGAYQFFSSSSSASGVSTSGKYKISEYEPNGAVAKRIASVTPYFPFKGIERFYDIGGFLKDPEAFQLVVDVFVERCVRACVRACWCILAVSEHSLVVWCGIVRSRRGGNRSLREWSSLFAQGTDRRASTASLASTPAASCSARRSRWRSKCPS